MNFQNIYRYSFQINIKSLQDLDIIVNQDNHISTTFKSYSPSASQVLGAHTSRLSFAYGFKRQWYSSGFFKQFGYVEQFFSNALLFHSDEFIGQLSMTDTESADVGQGSDIFPTSGL